MLDTVGRRRNLNSYLAILGFAANTVPVSTFVNSFMPSALPARGFAVALELLDWNRRAVWVCVLALALAFVPFLPGVAQELPTIVEIIPVGGELQLRIAAPAGFNSRLERSVDLAAWHGTYTFPRSAAIQQFTDSGIRFDGAQYYRVVQLAETNALTGDHLNTADGDVVIHPVNHASFVMTWKDQVIYADPVGGASLYKNFPRPTVVLVTDVHGDHLESVTINGIGGTNAAVVVPPAVLPMLSTALRGVSRVMTNGASLAIAGMQIYALPMYNTTTSRLGYHSKGRGNGYVLTLGGRRIYLSGDTEDIREMRDLRDIDAAFVCMNLPFTMDVNQAASAVREFLPRTVYPYHYSDSAVTKFKQLVGTNLPVEVRLRKWY